MVLLLFDPVAGLPGWAGTLLWRWFCSDHGRRSVLNSAEHQEAIGRNYVGYLRVIVAEYGYDTAAMAFVVDLRGFTWDGTGCVPTIPSTGVAA